MALVNCSPPKPLKIFVTYEEPQHQIATTLAEIVNENGKSSLSLVKSDEGTSASDALLNAKADFAILDNQSLHSERIRTVVPLFKQVLHLLVRNKLTIKNNTVQDLLTNRKIYAGDSHTSARQFVQYLITDYDIDPTKVEFVDVARLFDADVIFSFTDLLTQDELKDLVEYQFFSFDRVSDLRNGSLIEGICTRHPEFQPFVINRQLYGNFTTEPIVTVSLTSVLVSRDDVGDQVVYDLLEAIESHKTLINNLNPLLYDFDTDFNAEHLTFQLHPGTLKYLTRFEPVFIQKYADLLGVIISIVVAAASFLYSLNRWKNTRKKDKIDIYYGKLMAIRTSISQIDSPGGIEAGLNQLRSIQEETMKLVMREKLNADESFLIFLSISKIIHDDLKERLEEFSSIGQVKSET